MTFTPGNMLEALHRVEDDLPDLLRGGVNAWQSLDIDYDPPHVERLWRPHHRDGDAEGVRIYLHRIHPCETALFHPHPWPSAIRVITGRYEMGIGYHANQRDDMRPLEVARVVLSPGDQYEMIEQAGWHYVKPLDEPSLSLMVTAWPFKRQIFDHAKFGKAVTHKHLSPEAKAELLAKFTYEYHYWRSNR